MVYKRLKQFKDIVNNNIKSFLVFYNRFNRKHNMIDYKKLSNEQIRSMDEVMYNFDFEKVQKVMNCLEWGWGYESQIPDIYEMKQVARGLLADAYIGLGNIIGGKSFSVSTGGFTATAYRDDSLTLSFVVEEWEHFTGEN